MEAIYEVVSLEHSRRSDDPRKQLDTYRTVLEPYIYHYLIERNMSYLNEFWKTYTPPKEAKNAFVLVERRAHPNFEFLLKNIAWADPKNSVYIFCSDVNIKFILAILGNKAEHYNIILAFNEDVSREQGKIEYNTMLTSSEFYKTIEADYILTVQMDNFFRRKLPPDIYTGDYWGNPWEWVPHIPGGGGATVRRVAKMIELCESFKYEDREKPDEGEDSWLSYRIMDISGEYPPFKTRQEFIMESCITFDPYILHQFWSYVEQYLSLSKKHFIRYWSSLLELQTDEVRETSNTIDINSILEKVKESGLNT